MILFINKIFQIRAKTYQSQSYFNSSNQRSCSTMDNVKIHMDNDCKGNSFLLETSVYFLCCYLSQVSLGQSHPHTCFPAPEAFSDHRKKEYLRAQFTY